MQDQDSVLSGDLEKLLASLRVWLHSETAISEPELMTFEQHVRVHPPEQEGVGVTVTVRNDAPVSSEGGEVVFIGVGLRTSDGRAQGTGADWRWDVRVARPSDRHDLRQRYDRGSWSGGPERFRAVTSNEESFGQVLFPGESVVYEMRIPTADLPYTNIQVEGSVSRRHLFRFVHPMEALEQWTRPVLLETFRTLNAIGVHGPVLSAWRAVPELGPGTTLADLQACKTALGEAMQHIDPIMEKLNEVFHSAPNQEVRDHLKGVVGRHLGSFKESCTASLEALSSGDTERMQEAVDSLRREVAASEEVDRKTQEVMSRYGITAEEAGFRT